MGVDWGLGEERQGQSDFRLGIIRQSGFKFVILDFGLGIKGRDRDGDRAKKRERQ